MMINRRHTKDQECSGSSRQTLKLRKFATASLLSLVCLVAVLEISGASAYERRLAPSNTDEDLQVNIYSFYSFLVSWAAAVCYLSTTRCCAIFHISRYFRFRAF